VALAITTDLVRITDAEALDPTPGIWVSIGAGGSGALAIEPDFFAQAANCTSRGVSGVGTIKGQWFNLESTVDLTNKLLYIWMRCSTPGLIDTRANSGMTIRVAGSNVANYHEWAVDGSDTILGTDGWKCYVLDVSLPPTTVGGTGLVVTSCQHFGGTIKTTGTAKGQNFGIDAIYYGLGELRVSGTNTTPGAGFKEMADADFGTIANRYGVTLVKEGIIYVQGRVVLGDNVGTLATNFTSYNETLVWTRQSYYDGTRERDTVKDERADGTPWFGIVRVGNATNDTNVDIGIKVGSGDTATGRSGGSLTGSRIRTSFIGQSGTVKSTSHLNIYGAAVRRFWGGVDLTGNVSTDELHGGSVSLSGTVQTGKVKVRNTSFIDNYGGAYKFLEDFINDGVANQAIATADPRTDWGIAVGGTQLTVPAGVDYVRLDSAAAVRNVVKINSDVVGSDDHYVDAIVRFPAGSDQGVIGILFRGHATLATEDYWFLKLDRPNSQITLVRCDAGTDTDVDGPDAFTFAADTDYQIHIRGSGTTIEAFVNGTKLSATSSTHQTNRRVGIRGTTNTSQSANAEPRISRFGCGPITNVFGAARWSNTTDANLLNCNFINNGRAADIASTGTYVYTGHSFSGNLVGLRNDSGGSVTINASGGSPEASIENVGAADTTVNNTVTYTLTNLKSGSEVRIYKVSDGSELAGSESSGTSFAYAYTYAGDTAIHVHVNHLDWEWLAINDTLVDTNKETKVFQRTDRNYLNP
jgi:hypothetical protein